MSRKEFDVRQAEIQAIQKKTDERIDKVSEQLAELSSFINNNARETDERIDKVSAQLAELSSFINNNARETDERIDKVSAQLAEVGSFINNNARETEEFFAGGIKKNNLQIGKYQFNEIDTNVTCWRPRHGVVAEIDIYLENGSAIALIEVKNTLHKNDVEKHRDKRIPKFLQLYPNDEDKEVIGMVAGKVINSDALELAHKYGFVILSPEGQELKIDDSAMKALKI